MDVGKLGSDLRQVRTIVSYFSGRNILPGIDAALERLEAGDLDGVRSIYKTFLQSKGLLGDFYVSASDYPDAALLNNQLSELLDELWSMLE